MHPDKKQEDGIPLEVLGLSTRVYNGLRRAGLDTVEEIALLSDEELLQIRNLGQKALVETKEKMDTVGYGLLSSTEAISESTSLNEEDPILIDDDVSVTELGLLETTHSALEEAGFSTVKQLAGASSQEIKGICANDIRVCAISEALREYRQTLVPPEAAALTPREQAIRSVEHASIDALKLTVRPYNALARDGIITVGTLARMSPEEILEVQNIGEKSLAEIEEKLESYLAEVLAAPEQDVFSESSRTVPKAILLDRAAEIPLDAISIERLGLVPDYSDWLRSEKGVDSIAELLLHRLNQDGQAEIGTRLRRYLEWLVEQEGITWDDEISSKGISPLYRQELSGISLEDLVNKWLSIPELDDRSRLVMQWRYGLYDEELTLKEVGDRLGITRERARQIQNRTLRTLSSPKAIRILHPLMELLRYLLEKECGLMSRVQLIRRLEGEFAIGDIDPVGVAELVFELDENVRFLRRLEAWGLKSYPLELVRKVQDRFSQVLREAKVPLSTEEVIARFKATRLYHNQRESLEDDFILACLKGHCELSIDQENQCYLDQWENHRTTEIILALREIGEPVHYETIAKETNALLPKKLKARPRLIYAELLRRDDLFVRVGKGIFGLKEWGIPDDGNLANAAHRVLSEAGKPLHYEVITDRVLETWRVRPSSVYVALQSDHRFISIGTGVFWIRDRLAGESQLKESSDFGDLFGSRLDRWQKEWRNGEGDIDHDTGAEVDRIRKAGLDFFG